MIGFVWAQDENGVIGDGKNIPWDVKADRQFYRLITLQGDVLHGRITQETIPGGYLKNRRNIVLTRNQDCKDENAIVVHSKDEVLKFYEESDNPLMISGGAKVFEQFLDEVTHLYRTIIHTEVDGNIIMPDIDFSKFTRVYKKKGSADADNEYDYTIEMYKRNDLIDI